LVTRRQLLARTGAAAAAWPFLGRGLANAAGPPLRLILWPSLNGAEAQYFWPSPGNLGAMSAVTSPLAPYQKQITFVSGVNIEGSFNHMAVRSMFTGFPIADYASPDPTVKSLDQVMADYFAGSGPTPMKSLHLGAIPADSLGLYQLYGRSTFFFSPKPVDYEANPVTAFDRIFKGATAPPAPTPGSPTGPTGPVSYDSDVLDLVDAELAEMSGKVKDSPGELRKLDQHRAALKGLRPAAPTPTLPGMTPAPPSSMGAPGLLSSCDASMLASVEKLRPNLQGKPGAAYQHQYYSDIFDAQIDIMSRALICGLTRVATLQAGSADGNVTDPVGPGYPHHNTSHGNQMIFTQCQNWYATKFLRLLKSLDVPDPLDSSGKTVLYNSVILWMSECLPVGHESNRVPTLIAGNAGGALKAGAYLDLKSVSNKALLQSVVGMMGAGTSMSGHFGGQTISELRA
jgi:hypothetical protein